MRIVHDGFAHIDNNLGQRLHTKVRVQRDDQNRIAVFLSPSAGPQHVYSLEDVTVTKVGANCSHPVCHGKANRSKLMLLWEASEKATANAG